MFDGAFDALAVARAQAALVALPEQDRLVLDISKVSEVDWCALASLGAKLVGVAPHRVLLTGYCAQHARLLAYLDFGGILGPEPPGPRTPVGR